MKHVKNVWAFAVVLLIMTQLVSAQVRTVNGTVTDENSNPLAGISVQVKGGTAGTATNEEGVFHLEVPAGEIVLTFSSIGFRSEEVTVGGENQLTVVLESDAAALDEIVVIGYGTSKRRDLTGAISSISGDQVAAVPVANASRASTEERGVGKGGVRKGKSR